MQPNSTTPSTGQRLANNQTSIIRSPPAKRRRTTFSNNLPNNNTSSSSSQGSPSSPPSISPSPSRSPSPQPNPSSRLVNPARWFRKPNVVWYRGHDLRVDDHPSLLQAAQRGGPVVPLFIWDEQDEFGANLGHEKSWWLKESLKRLSQDLSRLGVKLYTRKGRSADQLRSFLAETGADAVYWNRFYIPSLLQRDEELRIELSNEGFTAESFVSELLVEPWEVTNTKTHPCFESFSEYRRKWKTVRPPPEPFPSPSRLSPLQRDISDVGIQNLGLNVPPQIAENLSKIWIPGSAQAKLRLSRFLHDIFPLFGEERHRKHNDGSSRLSPHVRFGEVSPRRMYHATRLRVIQWDSSNSYAHNPARANLCRRPFRPKVGEERQPSPPVVEQRGFYNGKGVFFDVKKNSTSSAPAPSISLSRSPSKSSTAPSNQCANLCRRIGQQQIRKSARAFLKNLCLRDFSYHILFHNPDFNRKPLIPEFNLYPWAKDEGTFDAWIEGRTGYPIIDAAMRELRATGWIHNRLRFLLACFLTKYLLLPWAKGLEKFYSLLLDGDRSANALGWQWTCGSNSDSFPLSCLVNPVKFGAVFDPNGNYIRKWIPELAVLGAECIHQPWKAKQDYLKMKNIALGSTYPERIVSITEARSRALSAMTFMKRICATSNIPRGVRGVIEEEQITEWPDKQFDLLRTDEESCMSGKLGLLPSLWAMLQCDQTPSYLTSSGTGTDNLIAMDTASLVEGALAVPLEDQNESIEHALITAHEHANTSVGLSIPGAVSVGDRYLDVGSFPHAPECETEAEMAENSADNVDMQNLDDQLKYPDSNMNVFSERGKSVDEPNGVEPSVSGSTNIQGPNEARTSHESKPTSDPGSISYTRLSSHQSSAPHASLLPQPLPSQLQNPSQMQQIQQFRHFQQFQALQRHQEQSQLAQQQNASHVQSANYNETSQAVKVSEKSPQPASNLIRTPIQQNPSVSGIENGAKVQTQAEPTGQLCNETLPQAGSHNRQPQPEFTSVQENQVSQGIPGFPLNNVDQTYLHPGSLNRNHANTIHSVSGNQMVMGAGIPGADGKGVQEFSVGESTNPVYHPQLGVNPFYGFQHVVSMINPHMLSGTDRQDILPTTSAANQAKMAIPGVVPFGYGMYPGNLFDPAMLTGTFPASNSYGPPVVTSQPQGQLPNHQASYSLSSHPMYYSPSTNNGPLPIQNGTSITGQLPENVTQSTRIVSSQPQLQNSVPLTTSAPISEGFRTNLSKDVTMTPIPQNTSNGVNLKPQVQQNGSKKVSNVKTGPSPSKMKTGTRARPGGRNRRGGASAGGSKGRTGKQSSRGRGGDSSHPSRSVVPRSPTTLKKRQEILDSVLEKREHEYYGFAQYLSVTYELTGNTDRHTSKDFVRLCNLKDDYHKRCNSEKEKLKIYRIKAFFSQILKLEVTGEWDRHMHGGVRGPYVYGIRARRKTESSKMETVAG